MRLTRGPDLRTVGPDLRTVEPSFRRTVPAVFSTLPDREFPESRAGSRHPITGMALQMEDSLVTILVVDDEALVRHSLEAGLRRHGYWLLQAEDGDEALNILATEPVDLVVTDLAMPRREGLETIIEIRRRYPHVKVIALSGVFGGLCLDMARQLGAAAALAKPVQIDVLRRTVDAVLASPAVRDSATSRRSS